MNDKRKIKALLLDMDGTVTDTEKYYNSAFTEVMHEIGYPEFKKSDALIHRSLNHSDARAYYKKKYGESFDWDMVHDRTGKLVKEYSKKYGVKVKSGFFELMDFCKENNIRRAIVTATGLEDAKKRLEAAGVIDFFSDIISAHDVKKGKPYPDAYLFALRTLHLSAGDCITVEDSPNGIRSSVAAGIRTIMVPDLSGPDEELKKILFAVCPDLKEVRNYLISPDR